MIIFDTNLVSEILRPVPEPKVEAWLATQSPIDIYMTAVSEAELRYGAAIMPEGKRRGALIKAYRAHTLERTPTRVSRLSTVRLPKSMRPSPPSGDRQDGRSVNSIARSPPSSGARDAAVATRNAKDFEGRGIEVIDPWNQG